MKDTTTEDREAARMLILRTLKSAGELGLNHVRIHVALAAMGMTHWTVKDVKEEMPFLRDMTFVVQGENKFVGELARWTLTEPGRVALAEQGL